MAHQEQQPSPALALGCLKKEAFEQAVKQCTELGVGRFIPFASDKAHLRDYRPAYLERLRRIAISAMKQSFRPVLPAIEPAIRFEGLLERLSGYERAVVAHADGTGAADGAGPSSVLLVVGAEGGFTSEELVGLETRGCEFVSVSPNRLRSETAAAALATLVMALRPGPQRDA